GPRTRRAAPNRAVGRGQGILHPLRLHRHADRRRAAVPGGDDLPDGDQREAHDPLHRVGAAHVLLHGRRAPGDLDPLRLHEGGAARRPPDRRPLARRGERTPRRRGVRGGAAVGPPPAPGLNQHGGSERPQAPGWLETPRRSRGAPREPGLRAPPSPRVARDAPAEPWRPSRTRAPSAPKPPGGSSRPGGAVAPPAHPASAPPPPPRRPPPPRPARAAPPRPPPPAP